MNSTPSHQHMQSSRVPLTPPQPAVTVRLAKNPPVSGVTVSAPIYVRLTK